MFTYKQWRAWLQMQASALQNEGFTIQFGYGPDDGNKPGMGLGVSGRNALGMFQNWVTGETDYTIHAPPGGKMVSHKWGLKLTDDTFEAAFNEFIAEFRKYDVAS